MKSHPPTDTSGTTQTGFAGLAQTQLQLFQQMRHAGYTTDDLTTVAASYQIATRLFANRFRGCGKPFVAHLVGTSAVLVWLKAPVPSVVAALLHAVYQEGDFANSLEGMTNRKRRQLKQSVGEATEELIAAYTVGSRSLTGILTSHARFKELSSFERDVLLLQLANEFDDYRDLAAHYSCDADERIDKIKQCGTHQVELATWLGYPELAQLLSETYRETTGATVPLHLRSAIANGYTIVPASCRIRTTTFAMRFGAKVRRRLRRTLGFTPAG